MPKQTLTTRVSALESDVAEIKVGIQALLAMAQANQPAATVSAPAEPKAPAATASTAKPKAYRSAAGKEAAKRACDALAVKYDLKVAGGSRTFKSLSAKEQAAYRAEQKAIWAAVPKTRTTKA